MSRERILPLPASPWSDEPPFGQSTDLNEYPSGLKHIRRVRSFRASLRGKLEFIIRAHGGYGLGGVNTAAKDLGVHRVTLRRWLQWKTIPAGPPVWERIDIAYEDALHAMQVLAARKCRR